MAGEEDDEYFITKALLLGCGFYPQGGRYEEGVDTYWWVNGNADDQHPLELPRSTGWRTKAALARDYVAYELEKLNGRRTET